jgi:hypothetical protein
MAIEISPSNVPPETNERTLAAMDGLCAVIPVESAVAATPASVAASFVAEWLHAARSADAAARSTGFVRMRLMAIVSAHRVRPGSDPEASRA